MNESFVVHAEYLLDIPEECKLNFYAYIMEYGIFGIVPNVQGFELKAWKAIQRRIDQDRLKYQQQTYKKRINAINKRIKDGNATETDLVNLEAYTKQYEEYTQSLNNCNSYSSYNTDNIHTGVPVSVPVSVSVSEFVSVSVSDASCDAKKVSLKPKSKIFRKPTREEMEAFKEKEHLDLTDIDEFFNYYETIGWVYGKNNTPIKSWEAAMRKWNSRQNKYSMSYENQFLGTTQKEDTSKYVKMLVMDDLEEASS